MTTDARITALLALASDRTQPIARRSAAFTAAIQIVYEHITGKRPQ